MGLDVAITGIGVVSALGHSARELHDRLERNELAIEEAPWTRTDPERWEYWAPVKDFDPAGRISEQVLAGTATFSQYTLVAAADALHQSGLDALDPLRTAIVVGTSKNGTQTMERAQFDADKQGRAGVSGKLMIQCWPNMAAAQLAMRWRLHGPCLTISTACASSLDAIGLGARMVASGMVDVALVGGTEGGLAEGVGQDEFVPATAYGRAAYGMGAKITDPAKACMPFDRHRGGMVFGEGTGMFLLESRAHARARNAKVHGWVQGWGTAADAYHPSSPDPSGQWEQHVMELALREAGVGADAVDMIAAHGTGTPKGDLAEIRAINSLLGKHVADVSVMSIKGVLGHPTGSAGALSLAVALEGIARQRVIQTGGTTQPDSEIAFDLVMHEPRKRGIEWLLVNAFGFGGQNASLVISADAAAR